MAEHTPEKGLIKRVKVGDTIVGHPNLICLNNGWMEIDPIHNIISIYRKDVIGSNDQLIRLSNNEVEELRKLMGEGLEHD